MWWTFRLSPMNFLRRDFKKRKPKHAVKLGEMPFLMRFRVRIVLQNKTTYFLMFLGVSLACILLLFGLMLKPLLDHYSDAIKKTQITKYQYVLKTPVPVRQKGIERYARYAISNSYPASTRVSNPAFISSVTPPQRTACSPKRSVSVSFCK